MDNTERGWPEWMGLRTVAAYLDTTPKAITRRRERDAFPEPKKLGKSIKWKRADIDKYVEGRTE